MGAGCGPNLDPQLSESRSNLAATTVTCPNGNQQALFGGGFGAAASDVVDIFDGGDSLERSIDSLSVGRSNLAGASVQCNNKGYALFGGGVGAASVVNDVDVFECNDDGISFKERLELSVARIDLAATSVQCNDKEYALFGGGSDGASYFNDVDVFECNDAGLFFKERLELSVGRSLLAATSVLCNDKGYALFGGGEGPSVVNDVDVFECNDAGLFFKERLELSVARFDLAATSVQCNDKGYALFGGGSDGVSLVNDVDVFECNDDGISFKERLELSVARDLLVATSVTAPDGKQYALFGGGADNTGFSDTVDIFHCNDNGVFYTKTANFNRGPPRPALAATTVNCGGVDYGLFGGGSDVTGSVFNDIDIFDSSSLEFI
ncbi:MAG: hypothetical protein ACR2M6_03470 [Vampirovibrionia bacterium]